MEGVTVGRLKISVVSVHLGLRFLFKDNEIIVPHCPGHLKHAHLSISPVVTKIISFALT